MKQFVKRTCFFFFFLGICSGFLNADTKLEYEVALTEKAQKVVDTILGEGKAIAVVNVLLDNQGTRLTFGSDKKEKKQELLPGYSGVIGMSASALPSQGMLKPLPVRIKNISVVLYVDKRVGRKAVSLISTNLSKVLRLYPERGDKIISEFQNFPKPMSDAEYNSLNAGESSAGGGFSNILIAFVLLVFVAIYVYFQQKVLKVQIEAAKKGSSSSKGGAAAGISKASLSPTGRMSSNISDQKEFSSYFKYISIGNILLVQAIFEKNNWHLEDIAIVLSKLHPSIVNHYFKESDIKFQSELVKTFMNQKETSFEILETLDKRLKEELDCSVGGQRVVLPILQAMDQSDKEKLFAIMKGNKTIFSELRPNVFLFEDILKVKDGDLKRLLGELDFDDLGKVMTDLHDHIGESESGSEREIYEKMLNALPLTTQALIEQQVTMKAGKYDEIEIEIALQHFFELIKMEMAEGHIHYEEEEADT